MMDQKQCVPGRRNHPTREERISAEHALHENDSTPPPSGLTPLERDSLNAKMYLLTHIDPDKPCLYDHLSKLLATILDTKPEGPIHLEDLTIQLKRECLRTSTDQLRTRHEKSASEVVCQAQWNLLKTSVVNATQELAEDRDKDNGVKFGNFPNMLRQGFLLEQAGVGLSREEMVRVTLSMKGLMVKWPIQNIRFWGKVLGTRGNYFIAEADFKDGEYESDVSDTEENLSAFKDDESIDEKESTYLKPIYKPPVKIPCEPAGTGLNRKVYFVCSELGMPWTKLPHVTPAQIQIARKIRKFFTGNLDSLLVTHPPFPGTERNYLRAQIARITASTQVSPIGYFRFDDEEEGEEAGEELPENRFTCVPDIEYEGISNKDLTDPTLQAWVHHMPAILPQGRITWFNPAQKEENEEDMEEGEEEEEREEPDEPQPEAGPPLLTPVSQDENVGESPPWIPRLSSRFVPEYGICVMHSNVWPGAVAFAAEKGKYFENIYIGWGQKNLGSEFEPALPDHPMAEFPSGPEITEADDPTPEEEAAIQSALKDKEFEAEEEDEGLDEVDDED
ncbi:hypothetical protein CHS0354_026721 [Potamilus streckersoni]|uniref:Uncharacterized protein n=1 Tax=Potamilus streckersoni TaxID=2493646 RepID=A0AAE0S7V7_9BIVA|nr:hypothetical protein CHS0354_026721 [Potamilus streckersoni]